jgi:uncharacterized protein
MRRLSIVALASALCGCSTAPIRYHTLLAPQESKSPSMDAANGLIVQVRIAHLPAAVDRRELVIRTGVSEVALLEDDWWAGPLRDEIGEALRFELRKGLAEGGATPAILGKLSVIVDVSRLEAVPGSYAAFSALWSADYVDTAVRHNTAAACSFEIREPIGTQYDAMVLGFQHELQTLSAMIVRTMSSATSVGTDCSRADGPSPR